MKNYINFVNDHSGSMSHLAAAAAKDFNANIEAVKNAASAEMLDTVVSVVEVDGYGNPLSVTISNPHVLKPVTHWRSVGGTPLWTSTKKLIDMLLTLPDIRKENVSVMVMLTTDGEATDGAQAHAALKQAMQPLLRTGRWSFVARIPKGTYGTYRQQLHDLGIPAGNIQEWATTAAGMAESTAQTQAAMSSFYASRTAGATSSSSFYANAAQVDITALKDVTSKISLYVVPDADAGIEIRPFILRHRMKHLKGAAFYQLTKTEARVQHDKAILVRDRASGKFFAGKEARQMIGLPVGQNARLHPGDHKNFDLFIQSNSINRKLVGGTGVAYWEEVGTEFTAADLDYLGEKSPFYVAPAKAVAAPSVIQLPAVRPTNKPTPSPIPVTPMRDYFETREDARLHCGAFGIVQSEIQKHPGNSKERRWSTPRAVQRKSA